MMPPSVMVLSDLYPSAQDPVSGTFVGQLTTAVSRHCRVVVVNPKLHFAGTGHSGQRVPGPSPAAEAEPGSAAIVRPTVILPPFGDRLAFRAFLYAAFSFRTVLDLRRRFDLDLIHAHMICPCGFAAILLGRLLRMPVVITAWGSDLHTYPNHMLLRRMTRFALERAEAVVTVSRSLKDLALRQTARAKRIEVILNGVDAEVFRPLDRRQARGDLGLPLDRLMILFVGALIERKGVSFLLEAFRQVFLEQPDTILAIVGKGELEEQLRASCMAYGLGGEAVLFAGARPHCEMPKWMNAADLLCLPSLHEGLPTVVVEALACGIPVVASSVDGTPEAIDSDAVGILCRPADAQDLARALRTATYRCRAAAPIPLAGTGLRDAVVTDGYLGPVRDGRETPRWASEGNRHRQGEETSRPWSRSALLERGRAFSYDRLAEDYVRLYGEVISRWLASRTRDDTALKSIEPALPFQPAS